MCIRKKFYVNAYKILDNRNTENLLVINAITLISEEKKMV